jgi:hypothetical protein
MEYNWQILDMNRLTNDGFVVAVYYSVTATDGEYRAFTESKVGYSQQPGETYIPYDELTEEIVLGWVQDSVGKASVEEKLAFQIETQKNPVTASGVPWLGKSS